MPASLIFQFEISTVPKFEVRFSSSYSGLSRLRQMFLVVVA
jgi:hypothetical protein